MVTATYDPEDDECEHPAFRVEPALGYLGDPAREDPNNGVCLDCGASVHMDPDEGWVTD